MGQEGFLEEGFSEHCWGPVPLGGKAQQTVNTQGWSLPLAERRVFE